MKIIYIASPYTLGDVAANVAAQMEAAHKILDMGHVPYWPLESHFLHLYRQRPYEEWLKKDLTILSRVDIVLRLPGESAGADREIAEANNLGIPVAFGWEELKVLV